LNHKVFDHGHDNSFHKRVIDLLAARGGGTLWIAFRAVRNPDTEVTDFSIVDDFIKSVFDYATGEDAEGNYRNVNIILYPHVNNAYPSTDTAMPLVEEVNDPRFTVSINIVHEYHAGRSDEASLIETFNLAKGRIGAVILCGIKTIGDFSIVSLEDSDHALEPFMKIVRDSEYSGPIAFVNHSIPEDTNDDLDYPEEYIAGSINEWVDLTKDVSLYETANAPFTMSIAANGSHLDINWNSRMGKFYDLASSTDLSIPTESWLPYNDGTTTYSNIHTSGLGINELTDIQQQAEGRFFVIQEKVRPTP
jgi:sugar phosphate isomerase/epimerase